MGEWVDGCYKILLLNILGLSDSNKEQKLFALILSIMINIFRRDVWLHFVNQKMLMILRFCLRCKTACFICLELQNPLKLGSRANFHLIPLSRMTGFWTTDLILLTFYPLGSIIVSYLSNSLISFRYGYLV